jgi:hypothetical protein
MKLHPPTPLSRALSRAIREVRSRAGRKDAPVVVITPSEANGNFARQQLALAGSFIRVEFLTPEQMIHALARRELAQRKLKREPSGWRSATIGGLLRDLDRAGQLESHAQALSQPGWVASLARTVETLETAGVDADQLERVDASAYADRLWILAVLLRGVSRRREVDRLYSSTELTDAAMRGVVESPWKAAIILGDRLLAPQVYDVIRGWTGAHPHIEVCLEPWHNLEPAPRGLRSAVRDDEPILVQLAGRPTLAKLIAGLFSAHSGTIEPDDSLTLARTPDDVRELGEATRVVLDAIRNGVPLDRIAVVLPDADHVVVLHEHFERLQIPATWLVGPPLSTTPAARFLLSCLDIAGGSDTVPAWYELLRLPGLRLAAAISPGVTEGRGRWRRVLARCGAVCNTQTILEAVEDWAAEIPDDARDPDGDRRAAENLIRTLRTLQAAFHHFDRAATLGAHARRWIAFLRRWWTPSPDLAQLIKLLRAWGAAGIGTSVPLDGAFAQLRHDLRTSAALRGRLTDQAVRVMTPMGLLGGAFDVVIVTGMTEGRFPRRPSEDPILPDDLIEQLNAELRLDLLPSHQLQNYEIRRFAAVMGACTKRLWLSAPATELLEARPLLPSVFLLDIASTLLGHRATYADLAECQTRVGSRAQPWTRDPERAVDQLEHRTAIMASDPRAGLLRIASDDTSRKLLGLQRALDQYVATRWTGKLSPGLLTVPGLDGSPLDPSKVAKFIANPGAFLVEDVLEIRQPARLRGRSDPLRPSFQDRLFLDALGEALDDPGPVGPAFEAAWEAAIVRWRRHRDDVDDEMTALLRGLAQQRFSKLERVGALPRGTRDLVSGRLTEHLPWAIEAQLGWREGAMLAHVQANKPARKQLARDATELVLAAMVQPGIAKIYAIDLDGKLVDGELGVEAAAVVRRLTLATGCTQQFNWWPWGDRHPMRLTDEHDLGYRGGELEPPTPRRPA